MLAPLQSKRKPSGAPSTSCPAEGTTPPVPAPTPAAVPSTASALAPQIIMFASGVAGLVGVFEVSAPLINLAGSVDAALVFPARVGAAAAVGVAGSTSVTFMESAFQTVTIAKVRAADAGTRFATELAHGAIEQPEHLRNEILQGAGAAAATGVILGSAVGTFPTAVTWTLAGAVGLSLCYSIGSFGFHAVRALRRFRRARNECARGDVEAARSQASIARHSVQAAGLAALETVTVAAVTNHLFLEVGHMLHDPGHQSGSKVVASSAENLAGALESVGEVAEALGIGVREAGEVAGAMRHRSGTGLTGDATQLALVARQPPLGPADTP